MKIPEHWTFNDPEVAAGFDAHVREQLPWYDLVTEAIAHLARHYVTPDSRVYDLGAATGNIGNALRGVLEERNAHLTALEPSAELAARYAGPGALVNERAEGFPYAPFSLAVVFLTLQFVPYSARAELIGELMNRAEPGGAVIIVDKTLPRDGYLGTVLYRLTLAGKLASGATPEDIIRKELSLGGAARPILPLRRPWREWFRFGDFAGYLYEKP